MKQLPTPTTTQPQPPSAQTLTLLPTSLGSGLELNILNNNNQNNQNNLSNLGFDLNPTQSLQQPNMIQSNGFLSSSSTSSSYPQKNHKYYTQSQRSSSLLVDENDPLFQHNQSVLNGEGMGLGLGLGMGGMGGIGGMDSESLLSGTFGGLNIPGKLLGVNNSQNRRGIIDGIDDGYLKRNGLVGGEFGQGGGFSQKQQHPHPQQQIDLNGFADDGGSGMGDHNRCGGGDGSEISDGNITGLNSARSTNSQNELQIGLEGLTLETPIPIDKNSSNYQTGRNNNNNNEHQIISLSSIGLEIDTTLPSSPRN
jgi:hypothetical protein